MLDQEKNVVAPGADQLSYDSYLKISELLKLQQPLTKPEEHDETLFIIIHQVYELWFKQVLHEVSACEAALGRDELMPFMHSLKRIITIFQTLTAQIDILETMTPHDFNRFRANLNPASGFQSAQFRFLEFHMGAKNPDYLRFYHANTEHTDMLEAALNAPTFYDLFLRYLGRQGFGIPQEVLKRDFRQPHTSNDAVTAIFAKIYEDPSLHYDLYMALEALCDLDQKFLLWRYRHVAMVSRMIGTLRGTGGSSGVQYLTGTLQKKFFPEIWDVRSHLYSGSSNQYGQQPAAAR